MTCYIIENLINFILGCPSIIWSDYQIENSILAACHMALCHNHDDEFSGSGVLDLGLPQQTQLSIYDTCIYYICSSTFKM